MGKKVCEACGKEIESDSIACLACGAFQKKVTKPANEKNKYKAIRIFSTAFSAVAAVFLVAIFINQNQQSIKVDNSLSENATINGTTTSPSNNHNTTIDPARTIGDYFYTRPPRKEVTDDFFYPPIEIDPATEYVYFSGSGYDVRSENLLLDNQSLSKEDITELNKMTNLESISMQNIKPVDVSPFKDLPSLKYLQIFITNTDEIEYIENYIVDLDIQYLSIDINVNHISVNHTELNVNFNLMKNLKELSLVNTTIDFASLNDLDLEIIIMNNCGIENYHELWSFKNLNIATFSNTFVVDMDNVTSTEKPSFEKLESLYYDTMFSKTDFIKYTPNLKSLMLTIEDETKLPDLTHLKNLEELTVYQGSATNLDFIKGLTNLRNLRLSLNNLSDISALSTMTELERLTLKIGTFQLVHGEEQGYIVDISPLSQLKQLTHLNLANNKIADISALTSLTALKELILANNNISDIKALSNLTNLECLYIDGNDISDIKALSNLTSLECLCINGNKISDISPLSSLTLLSYLNIYDLPLNDLTPLYTLLNLDYLDFDSEDFSESDIEKLKSNLPNIYIYEYD